jgi:uncharacterized protein
VTDTTYRTPTEQLAIDQGLQSFFSAVYSRMCVAMLISGVIAYVLGNDMLAVVQERPTEYLSEGFVHFMLSPIVQLITCFSPLVFMIFAGPLLMSSRNPKGAKIGLYTIAALFGLSLSTIFVHFTQMSIAQTFAGTAAAFAGLSIFGYTTKKDLSAIGRFLIMALVGVIIATILNMFIQSGPLDMLISVVGVLAFSGLTAYDTQKLKSQYLNNRRSSDERISTLASMGALDLYLDFIGLFVHLLQLVGSRR